MNGDDVLGRFATAVLKLIEHEHTVNTWRDLVESLEHGRLEHVAGERQLLDELGQRLEVAFKLLRSHPLTAQLQALEALVDDVVWETTAALKPVLEAKQERQATLIREVESQLKAWDVEVAELAKVVDGARLAGAPFTPLDNGLKAADRRRAILRTSLAERRYADLREQCDEAKITIMAFADKVRQAEEQMIRVKTQVRQADLLIMRTGSVRGKYIYNVLLRCPDRAESGGINIIQDVRYLSRTDRDDYLKKGIERLTEDINVGLRTSHVKRRDAPRAECTITPAAAPGGVASPDLRESFRQIGEFMWKMLIPTQMRALLNSQNWSFSITTNDLELPWELICLDAPQATDARGDQFLCLTKSVSRMPLGDVFPQLVRRPRRDAEQKRRMLLIHSDPEGDLTAATDEVDSIHKQLGGLLDIVRLNPLDATNARLNQAFGADPPFDFIHYAGHAYFDAKVPDNSYLLLKDGRLEASKIRNLNRASSLVFLNACESGTVARSNEPQRVTYLLAHPDPVVGLASAFVYSGALGCVGSLWPVYDQPAAELAVNFYRYVLEGDPIGEALRRARAEIRKDYPDTGTWAGYVLYGDPTFRLTEP